MHVNVYFLSALAGVLALAWEALRTFKRSQTHNIEELIVKAIEPLLTRMVVLETKMDMVIGGVAIGAANVLHHPEPTRARVDYLLDCFREGFITEAETDELKGYLHTIMTWEPTGDGAKPPFTLFPGEPTAAALMLATMDHVRNTGELSGLLDPPAGSSEEAGTGLPD